jgi:hypothetical protein
MEYMTVELLEAIAIHIVIFITYIGRLLLEAAHGEQPSVAHSTV